MERRMHTRCEQPSMHTNVNKFALRDSKYMVHITELTYETQASVELQYWSAGCSYICEKYLSSDETRNMRSGQPEQQHCLCNSGWDDLMRNALNAIMFSTLRLKGMLTLDSSHHSRPVAGCSKEDTPQKDRLNKLEMLVQHKLPSNM